MLKNVLCSIGFLFCCITTVLGQNDAYTYAHEGEFGLSVGKAYYFGDLRPNNNVFNNMHAQLALGLFYHYQVNEYIGFKLSGNYAKLGYADAYNNKPEYTIRNLSFENQVWEANITGIFNFFKFIPAIPEHRFTPYIGLGIGAFYHNPYTFYQGKKYFLRTIGTEGQGSEIAGVPKPYSKIGINIPLSIGVKYAINSGTNIFADVCFRFTNTDYLDDVSTVYSPNAFTPNSIGFLLQDRSHEVVPGNQFGVGKQRGSSTQKDAFATFQIGLSFNLQGYRCPKF